MNKTETAARKIKLIAVDLDGTLLNSQHTLSERNRDALRRAIEQGVQVILATGKTRRSADSIIAALNIQSPGIYSQGLVIVNADGTVRHQQTFDAQLARRIIPFAEERGFGVLIYSGFGLLARAADPRIDEIISYGEPQPEMVGPLVNILDTRPVNKLLIVGEQPRLRALRYQLDKMFGAQITLTTAGLSTTIEVLPPNTSKGRALRLLANELSIAKEEILAIGDGENDREMLQFAGIGLAVANADPHLKEVADEVIASNNEDGVAQAVEKYVLQAQAEAAPTAEQSASAVSEEA